MRTLHWRSSSRTFQQLSMRNPGVQRSFTSAEASSDTRGAATSASSKPLDDFHDAAPPATASMDHDRSWYQAVGAEHPADRNVVQSGTREGAIPPQASDAEGKANGQGVINENGSRPVTKGQGNLEGRQQNDQEGKESGVQVNLEHHLKVDRGDPLSLGTAVHMLAASVRAYLLKDLGFLYPDKSPTGAKTTYVSEGFVMKHFVAVLKIHVGNLEGFPGTGMFGPKNITVQASIGKDETSIAVTHPRPVKDPDFSRGGMPLYLWVPHYRDVYTPEAQADPRLDEGLIIRSHYNDQFASSQELHGSPPELTFRIKGGNNEMYNGKMTLPADWYTAQDPVRQPVAMRGSSQPKNSSLDSQKSTDSDCPMLPVEVCVLRVRPTGWYNRGEEVYHKGIKTVADGHIRVPDRHHSRGVSKSKKTSSKQQGGASQNGVDGVGNQRAVHDNGEKNAPVAVFVGKSPLEKNVPEDSGEQGGKGESDQETGDRESGEPRTGSSSAPLRSKEMPGDSSDDDSSGGFLCFGSEEKSMGSKLEQDAVLARKHRSPGEIVAGSISEDIEPVEIVWGDFTVFQPLLDATENFAKVFPGEFMTATDAQGKGAEPVALIENKEWETQLLILRNEHLKQVVVAFQGSSETLDWIVNARIRPDPNELPTRVHHQYPEDPKDPNNETPKQPGRMHNGWKSAWMSVEAAVFAAVDRVTMLDPQWTVCLTGHSLGGALSIVSAEAFASRHPDDTPKLRIINYSFASPQVGSKEWVAHYNRSVHESWRFAKSADFFPDYLPLLDLLFQHVKGGVSLISKPGGKVDTKMAPFEDKKLILAWSKVECEEFGPITTQELKAKKVLGILPESLGFVRSRLKKLRSAWRQFTTAGNEHALDEYAESLLTVALKIIQNPIGKDGDMAPMNEEAKRTHASLLRVKALYDANPRRAAAKRSGLT